VHRTRPHGHGQDLLAGSWSGTESPVSAHQLCKYVCQWPLTLRVSLTFKYLAPWNPPSLSLGYLLVCVCVCGLTKQANKCTTNLYVKLSESLHRHTWQGFGLENRENATCLSHAMPKIRFKLEFFSS